MDRKKHLAVTSAVALFVGTLFVLALGYGELARLVPLAVVVPVLALVFLQWGLDLVGVVHAGDENGSTPTADSNGPNAMKTFGWLLLFPGLAYLLGFAVGAPVFTLLFSRIRSRESWRLSVTLAAATWVVAYGGFVVALGARLYEGWLFRWL